MRRPRAGSASSSSRTTPTPPAASRCSSSSPATTSQVASDGLQALRLVDEFEPHVALVDLGLPVLDGFEVARRIRAGAPDAAAPRRALGLRPRRGQAAVEGGGLRSPSGEAGRLPGDPESPHGGGGVGDAAVGSEPGALSRAPGVLRVSRHPRRRHCLGPPRMQAGDDDYGLARGDRISRTGTAGRGLAEALDDRWTSGRLDRAQALRSAAVHRPAQRVGVRTTDTPPRHPRRRPAAGGRSPSFTDAPDDLVPECRSALPVPNRRADGRAPLAGPRLAVRPPGCHRGSPKAPRRARAAPRGSASRSPGLAAPSVQYRLGRR